MNDKHKILLDCYNKLLTAQEAVEKTRFNINTVYYHYRKIRLEQTQDEY